MLAGRFSGETIFTSWRTTVSPGSVSSQLPPASPARSTIDRARLHPPHGLAGDELRRRPPGHERGRDDDVEALDRVGQRLLLARALLLGQLACVAALAAGLQTQVEPLRAERLHLLGDLRAHVIAGRARAQALGRRERLQAGDADTQHEHLGGRDRAGGGHQHRVEAPHLLGARAARPCSRRRCSARTARPSTGRGRCAGSPPSRTRSPSRRRARASSGGLGQRREEADQDRAGPEPADLRGRRAGRS